MDMTTHRRKTPGRPPGFDRDAALEVALDALWAGGYEATPIGDLIARMGLSRSSFYAAFGSKRGAMLSAIRYYSAGALDELRALAARGAPPRDRLRAMAEIIASIDDDRGCFIVNCITELARRDEDVRAIAGDHNAALERLLGETLGELDVRNASTSARTVLAASYGVTVLKTAGTEPDSLRRTLSDLIDAI